MTSAWRAVFVGRGECSEDGGFERVSGYVPRASLERGSSAAELGFGGEALVEAVAAARPFVGAGVELIEQRRERVHEPEPAHPFGPLGVVRREDAGVPAVRGEEEAGEDARVSEGDIEALADDRGRSNRRRRRP